MIPIKGEVLLVSEQPVLHDEWFRALSTQAELIPSSTREPLIHSWYEPDPAFRLVLLDHASLGCDIHEVPPICTSLLECSQVALINAACNLRLEQSALKLGLSGVFHKGESANTLLKGILSILSGELWFRRSIIFQFISELREASNANNTLANQAGRQAEHLALLTQREQAILSLLAEGATYQEVAEKCAVSYHTVKTHVYRILKKTGSRNRTEAINWAKGDGCQKA